jgi:hypothetical protein
MKTMTKEEISRIAEAIRDGKATEQEKLEFFRAINVDLKEISKVLAKMPKKKR